MKIIVIGPSLSGKTTLIRSLRLNSRYTVSEIDEELTALNGGSYPTDDLKKHTVLVPKVIKQVLETDDIIFFSNTDYFTREDLLNAKRKGFNIVFLDTSLETLQERNNNRVLNEGYSDLSQYLKGMLTYLDEMRDLADITVNTQQSRESVLQEFKEKVLNDQSTK